MENEYWINKWQTNDIAFHEKDINADLITYLHEFKLHPGDCIFVPLCGKTRDMLWLADNGLHVVGVELSHVACRDFFIELNVTPDITKQPQFTRYRHNNIELLCGDLFTLTSTDFPVIHAVYDCKALIALPPDIRRKYVDHIVSCFGDKIKILLLTRETSCKVNPPPFPIGRDEINLLYDSYFYVQQLKCLSISDIPERLIKKGYIEMTESVYLISGKK